MAPGVLLIHRLPGQHGCVVPRAGAEEKSFAIFGDRRGDPMQCLRGKDISSTGLNDQTRPKVGIQNGVSCFACSDERRLSSLNIRPYVPAASEVSYRFLTGSSPMASIPGASTRYYTLNFYTGWNLFVASGGQRPTSFIACYRGDRPKQTIGLAIRTGGEVQRVRARFRAAAQGHGP
jgi:hypothetical protein